MKLEVGKMDRKIYLQTAVNSRLGDGGVQQVWSDSIALWALKVPIRASEEYNAGEKQYVADVEYVIHYRASLNPGNYRLREGDKIYDIKAVEEMEVPGYSYKSFQKLSCDHVAFN